MKLRKIVSLAVTVAMVITSIAVVFTPVASADTVNDGTTFSEDFSGYTVTDNAKTTLGEMISAGWLLVNDKKMFDTTNDRATYNAITSFATVVEENGNKCLKLVTGNGNLGFKEYGFGRKFPGQSGNVASGIWDISFRVKSTKDFYFGVNRINTAAQHSIISAVDGNAYMGYRDYSTLYNNGSGVPQGNIGTINNDWYSVEAVVNCDAKYYSVELKDSSNNLIARRSPISFDSSGEIGFFKMSALGINNLSTVYIDDISITKTSSEAKIYEETFDSFTDSTHRASGGVTTGGASEVVTGDSYFEGYTPWRAYGSFNNYGLNSTELSSQVVQLGSNGTTGSALVYMPVYDKLIASPAQQSTRGMVKTSFKIRPSVVNEFLVTAVGDYSQQFTGSDPVAFKITKDGDDTVLMKNNSDAAATLSSSTWYNVDMVFDVSTGCVDTTVTENGTSTEVASFVREINTVKTSQALKGIAFSALRGSVYVDDVKFEYYKPATMQIAGIQVDSKNVKNISDLINGETDLTKSATVGISYSNPTDKPVNAIVALVLFDKDDRFIAIRSLSTAIDAGKSGTAKFYPAGGIADVEYAQIYLWDDVTNVKPYCNPWEITKTGITK